MKFLRWTFLTVFILFTGSVQALNVDFSNLTTQNFIKITSKIIEKDIFFEHPIKGKVNFVSDEPLDKNNVLKLLEFELKTKGYELKKYNEYFTINKETQNDTNMEVFLIKNLEAEVLYSQLQEHIKSKYFQSSQITPSLSFNQQNNSIVAVGSANALKIIGDIIKQLDVTQQQVYVEAKILELSETRVKNLGVQYGLNGFHTTGSTLNTFSSVVNNSPTLSALSLSELSTFGYSPAVMKHGLSLGVTINILNQNKALDVISEPSLLCINNQQSSIYVGETRAIATGTTVGTTTTTNYTRENIGLKLSVTPRISKKEKVSLHITTLLEDVKQTQVGINEIPSTNKKEIKTTAIVSSGESIVLGGLIKSKLETQEQKVPFFGDIPVLGTLFRSDHEIDDKINLVIIVTPYIVPKEQDLAFVRSQLARLEILTQDTTQKITQELLKNKEAQEKNDQKKQENDLQNYQHQQKIKEIFNL
jgi:general secretion pathway protein D